MWTTRSRSSTPEEKFPWSMWQRVVMVGTAFFISTFMSGVTLGHLGTPKCV